MQIATDLKGVSLSSGVLSLQLSQLAIAWDLIGLLRAANLLTMEK